MFKLASEILLFFIITAGFKSRYITKSDRYGYSVTVIFERISIAISLTDNESFLARSI